MINLYFCKSLKKVDLLISDNKKAKYKLLDESKIFQNKQE